MNGSMATTLESREFAVRLLELGREKLLSARTMDRDREGTKLCTFAIVPE